MVTPPRSVKGWQLIIQFDEFSRYCLTNIYIRDLYL